MNDTPDNVMNSEAPLRERRYDLTRMLGELPGDRAWLQLGMELLGQDEIGRVFQLKKHAHGKSRDQSKVP
jgi:hypothetical protein